MSDQGRRVGAAILNTSQCRLEALSAQVSALKFCTTVDGEDFDTDTRPGETVQGAFAASAGNHRCIGDGTRDSASQFETNKAPQCMETDVHTQGREPIHQGGACDQAKRLRSRKPPRPKHPSSLAQRPACISGKTDQRRCRQGRPGRGHQQGQLVRWKKTMSTYIELDGLDDVAEDAFKAESGATDVSLTIASVAGKHRTLKLTSLVNSSPTRSTRLRLC